MKNPSLALLQDVKIVAFTQFLLGPAAVQYLADMGAEVVKVEPTQGGWERQWSGAEARVEGVSAFFLLAHRNNRSLTLDLKAEEGLEVAKRLVAEADVVVSNFRPGVMDRLGLGYDELKRIKPNVIFACASGYGTESPHRDLPGQDLLLQAMTGLAAATGHGNQPPIAAGSAVVDQHAAALLALGIVGALRHRDRTGKGQRVEVTMVEAALDLQIEPVVYWLNGGRAEKPVQPVASSFHEAPYGIYPTRDGHVALSLSPIKRLRSALGGPESLAPFEDASIAFEKREEIYAAIRPLLEGYEKTPLVKMLRGHGVWCAPVNDYAEALADPVVAALDPILTLDLPGGGEVYVLKHPIRYESGEASVRQNPPHLGEHTDEVLREMGYSAEEISHLHAGGIV
jgi:crotonobetainyl-CoA:carnitine CoA-transferase CaiB-like acyl-CoA transferase